MKTRASSRAGCPLLNQYIQDRDDLTVTNFHFTSLFHTSTTIFSPHEIIKTKFNSQIRNS